MCNRSKRHGTDCGKSWVLVVISLLAAFQQGCGKEETTAGAGVDASGSAGRASQVDVPPVAAISSPAESTSDARIVAEPGSPEALLMQIATLIAQTNADIERAQATSTSNPSGPTDEAAAAFRRRMEQIIDLSTQVIALTHLDPEAEQSFNNAVHYLSDARLELASAGETAQAGLLIDDANSLYERDKTSFAAAEAGSKVVELAERMARNLGQDDPEWLTEYSIQARQFAERFPHETSRSAMALFNAGRLCDRFGLSEPARDCLLQVQTQFGETIFAEQSAGILRRLSLRGQPIELTGPTIDGGFVEIEQYAGRPVLVVFWSTTSPSFLDQLAALKQIESRFTAAGLAIIGVNLDSDEAAVDSFLTEQKLGWRQVFSADPSQRGGRNPVARYYGIQVLPTYWLVDGAGIVVNDRASIEDLPTAVEKLVGQQ